MWLSIDTARFILFEDHLPSPNLDNSQCPLHLIYSFIYPGEQTHVDFDINYATTVTSTGSDGLLQYMYM